MNGELIFDDSQAGFRLGTLQIYNWGVLQNNKTFTFYFSNKSTLLTGRNGSGKTKYLRDKNCFSIINGIFNNEITGQAVSLIQIRYFSNNALLTYSGVTEQALLISDIKKILAEADTKIDREKNGVRF